MRMNGCPCLTRRRFRRDPTDALFADQSQSILDNLVGLLRRSRAWNCLAGNCGCDERDQQATVPKGNDAVDGWGSAICPTADHGQWQGSSQFDPKRKIFVSLKLRQIFSKITCWRSRCISPQLHDFMGGAIDRLCVFNFEQRDAVAGLAELTSVDDGVVAGIPEGSRPAKLHGIPPKATELRFASKLGKV